MTRFRVWAPNAKQVTLRSGENVIGMESCAHGWWEIAAAGVDEYAFLLDGGWPLPEPRSPWQPQGVHGHSKVLDHSQFKWTDETWQAPPFASAVVYELHIGTFTREGTFLSAIAKLDYLKQLGITHVELMPVAEFSGPWGWGYDGVDLYAPHHGYGTPADLKSLVNACHERRLAVLLDVVYNHLGPSGNYLAQFGPYFNEQCATPWGAAVNLDGHGSREVRRYLCDNALMWLRDYHFDGLRLDAIHALFDRSSTHFLEQLADEVNALEAVLGRHFALIAESDLNDPRVVTACEAGGFGMDAQWSDDFHHALHTVLTGEDNGYYCDFGSIAQLAKALHNGYIYDGGFSAFRQRPHGRPLGEMPGHRLLAYLQNHDQIGNRAHGERSAVLVSEGRLKIASALIFTSPFVPMLFQGEEWGAKSPFQYFTQHTDEDVARKTTAGRIQEFIKFGWKPEEVPDPQNESTFRRSKLDWTNQDLDLLEWHRRLIALRRQTPALSDGRRDRVTTAFDETARWLRVDRGPISVVCNLGEALEYEIRGAEILLQSDGHIEYAGGYLRLPGDSAVILTRRSDSAPS